ncbi:MAG TPA: hypothetical protein DCX89_02265 [Saprospirales bacterium]|nr:hypothetical protein [Saprospirales bacterium]HAY70694.1 hypothetical protein [Saprospirales bacterium]HRQ28507.1 thiamine pyrophosphate-dependent enzyme [Saprospiraceae bacterium]
MTTNMLTDVKMPFCPGCGHGIIVKSISKSLEDIGYQPNDVVIVTDIGCAGLVDPLFNTHTVHGLHGRAPALGVGVAMGLNNKNKKVIVIQGDGGATIGLQHILEAARRNINLTLIVFNNLLYGMTGGQISGLSTDKFKSDRDLEPGIPPFDIVRLAHEAGAVSSARVVSPRNFNEYLKKALDAPGFSLIEMASMCTSYAVSKLKELEEYSEEENALTNRRAPVEATFRQTSSLFDRLQGIPRMFGSKIHQRLGIVLAGSAGGGVQSAAMLLAKAGTLSGLHSTMKGEYPVTVGTGFSIAEVILSTEPVHYTGLNKPDVLIIVSEDGLSVAKHLINKNVLVLADDKLDVSQYPEVISMPFVQEAGKRGAALSGLSEWIRRSGMLELQSLVEAIGKHKHGESLLKALFALEKKS